MPTKNPRAKTANEDRDRRQTPTSGVPIAVTVEEPTPPPQPMPVLSRVTTHDQKFTVIEQQLARVTEGLGDVWEARHTKQRFDKIDHTLEKLDDRLDKYAERVVTAEHAGSAAWSAVKDLGPKLDAIHKGLGETSRLADGVERIVARMDEHSNRLGSIEGEQKLAAERAKVHDDRVSQVASMTEENAAKIAQTAAEIVALKQTHALATNTEAVTKKVTSEVTARTKRAAARRAWWFSAKGISTVFGSIVALVTGIAIAITQACHGSPPSTP